MMTKVRVPIRTKPSVVPGRTQFADVPAVAEAVPPVVDREAVLPAGPPVSPRAEVRPAPRATREPEERQESLEEWRDRALRLQAEMENFRKRQQRLADERIAADRERLLRDFLRVADNLERALNTDGTDAESLRQGVDLTHQTLMRLLEQEEAEPIQAAGEPFDPAWHEAVSTVPHEQAGVEPDTVVGVVEAGYYLGDRLLRPARVVVAV